MVGAIPEHGSGRSSPRDKRQHVYVSRWRNDEWVMHEEIPEVEETLRVEWAAKRLVTEVQVCLA